MSAALMGNKRNLGNHASDETRAKMSMARTGKTASLETRAKISMAGMGLEFEPRVCLMCGAGYSPTGRSQKYCAECAHTLHLGYSANWRKAHPGFDKAKNKKRIAMHPGEGTAVMKAWRLANPERAAALDRKHVAKRRRGMGFDPMNKPFDGADGHHIDLERVIYLPRKLHRSIYHNHLTGVGMAKINAVAFNFLFRQEVGAALGGKQ